MASGSRSSLRKSICKSKGVMHGDNIYLGTEVYTEFIQRQFYVDETYPNPLIVIFEPTPPTQWKANLKIYPIKMPFILKFSMIVVMKTCKNQISSRFI